MRKPFKKMSRKKLRFPDIPDIKLGGHKLHVNAISTLPEINLRRMAWKQIYNFELPQHMELFDVKKSRSIKRDFLFDSICFIRTDNVYLMRYQNQDRHCRSNHFRHQNLSQV